MAGRREGQCAGRLVSRELSLYELDSPVHILCRQEETGSNDHAGERKGRTGHGVPVLMGDGGQGAGRVSEL